MPSRRQHKGSAPSGQSVSDPHHMMPGVVIMHAGIRVAAEPELFRLRTAAAAKIMPHQHAVLQGAKQCQCFHHSYRFNRKLYGHHAAMNSISFQGPTAVHATISCLLGHTTPSAHLHAPATCPASCSMCSAAAAAQRSSAVPAAQLHVWRPLRPVLCTHGRQLHARGLL